MPISRNQITFRENSFRVLWGLVRRTKWHSLRPIGGGPKNRPYWPSSLNHFKNIIKCRNYKASGMRKYKVEQLLLTQFEFFCTFFHFRFPNVSSSLRNIVWIIISIQNVFFKYFLSVLAYCIWKCKRILNNEYNPQ